MPLTTQHETNTRDENPCPQRDWTRDRSNRETTDLLLRPHGHRDRQHIILHIITFLDWIPTQFRYKVKYLPGYRKGLLYCSPAVTKTSKRTHSLSLHSRPLPFKFISSFISSKYTRQTKLLTPTHCALPRCEINRGWKAYRRLQARVTRLMMGTKYRTEHRRL
jgi:hypothetical protein